MGSANWLWVICSPIKIGTSNISSSLCQPQGRQFEPLISAFLPMILALQMPRFRSLTSFSLKFILILKDSDRWSGFSFCDSHGIIFIWVSFSMHWDPASRMYTGWEQTMLRRSWILGWGGFFIVQTNLVQSRTQAMSSISHWLPWPLLIFFGSPAKSQAEYTLQRYWYTHSTNVISHTDNTEIDVFTACHPRIHKQHSYKYEHR